MYAAYPGIDPMKLTVIRFIGLVDLAPAVHRRLNLQLTREAEESEVMDEVERSLKIDTEFPALSAD